MKAYEFLPHTADVKFRAYGKSLEEAFQNAALATFAIMTDIKKVKAKTKKRVSVKAKSKETLLYDFIQELLFFVDTEGFLLHSVEELTIQKKKDGYHLHSVLVGDSGEQYEIVTQIKSATYNDMFIKEEKNAVTIQMVLDI
ncbi:archease [Candidatus Woesearchaeota archaeon]|nr:archease [Candidatus Woesearchaeota archaeon]